MQEKIGDLILERYTPEAGIPRNAFPLLCINGIFGGSGDWKNFLPYFASRGWDAWALNLRGHHGSRPVENIGAVSLRDYALDVKEVLEFLGPTVLMGHSMGGLIAQLAASHENVKAAVFITPAAPKGISMLSGKVLLRTWRYAIPWILKRGFKFREADARALLFNRMTASQAKAAYEEFVEESGRAALELSLGLRSTAVDERNIHCSTLVIEAVDDIITPKGMLARVAEKYGSDYLFFKGHGHMIIVEDGWKDVADRISDWLDAHT